MEPVKINLPTHEEDPVKGTYAVVKHIYHTQDDTLFKESAETEEISITDRDHLIRKIEQISKSNQEDRMKAKELEFPYYTVLKLIKL